MTETLWYHSKKGPDVDNEMNEFHLSDSALGCCCCAGCLSVTLSLLGHLNTTDPLLMLL